MVIFNSVRFIGFLLIFMLLSPGPLWAQYHPAADQPGTSAIHKDSTVFVGWASYIFDFQRGPMDISQPALGVASHGDSTAALFKANNQVVSLGDSGYITLGFPVPLSNGPGWDFAVFSNAFSHTFLELAFVEVSSDGEHFVRFPASSLTDTSTQVSSFGSLDPEEVNNLAGKYMVEYGTPFDLEEVKDAALIDVDHIKYVRIVDVIGSMEDSLATRDAQGRKVNDPFPTPFAAGGFDLDAVGVIHDQNTSDIYSPARVPAASVYPNPASETIHIRSPQVIERIRIKDINGRTVLDQPGEGKYITLSVNHLSDGLYFLFLYSQQQITPVKMYIAQ